MPEKTVYACVALGATVAGITYKLRIGEKLKPHEWVVLCISLCVWGLVAFLTLSFYFPVEESMEARAGLSIPLGVGLSEIFAVLIVAGKVLAKDLPEIVESWVRKK